ncbi:DUF6807 family protein [Sunxiuqinia sp. A32]|uniref:DUF6807 family protein n=1 Tax=Sunxiuqinia sp. A32 TaxID=3461496 RepID=UPI004046388C
MNQIKKYTFLVSILLSFVIRSAGQVGMKKDDGGFWFVEKGRKIAFYRKENATPNQAPARNNYLHPVYLPDGAKITEDAPADHIHHRGIFWTWHQIVIDGKPIGDPWMLEDFEQEVQNVEFRRLPNGNGEFTTSVYWSSPQYQSGETPYMEEQTTMTFFPLQNRKQVILFEIKLKALADNLKLGGSDDEKGYGGFSVRMKLPDDLEFTSKNGVVEPQTNAVDEGQYINMNGAIGKNGNKGGVFVYADPKNQDDTQKWILRRKESMQNAVFPGREPIQISSQKPIVLKYALVLYNGSIKEDKVARKIAKLFE